MFVSLLKDYALGSHNGPQQPLTALCTQCIVNIELYRPMTGEELRRIRKRFGLTQAALAKRLAVTSTSVARWERGEVAIQESMARFIRLLRTTGIKSRVGR